MTESESVAIPRKLPKNGQITHKNACFLPLFDFFSPITPQSFDLKNKLVSLDCNGENSVAINAKYQGIGNSDALNLLPFYFICKFFVISVKNSALHKLSFDLSLMNGSTSCLACS